MTAFTEISIAQFARLTGTPAAPLCLDIRLPEDVAADPYILPGAIPCDWQDIPAMVALAQGRNCVVYCQKGLKISQGVAARLRIAGVAAETLEGGHVAWRNAGMPMVDLSARPDTRLWVTRHRPKIDRVACPWLIRRFIDPQAKFLFVAPAQVQAVAERFSAEPFDIEGARFGHAAELCTFDALLSLILDPPDALARMAEIIRSADLGRPDRVAEAPGVTAILLGLSRMESDDLSQMEAAIPILDALYRWARDALDETHREDLA